MENITRFCKSQVKLLKIDSDFEDERAIIANKLQISRNELIEIMDTQNITCIQLFPKNKSPLYLRLQQKYKFDLSIDTVFNILQNTDVHGIIAKHGKTDLPTLFSVLLQEELQVNKKKIKPQLLVTNKKERGFEYSTLNDKLLEKANNFIDNRQDDYTLRKNIQEKKEICLSEQKEITDHVKHILKENDCPTRINIQQDGKEKLYYLKYKEMTIKPKIGIRKMSIFVKEIFEDFIEKSKLNREYNGSLTPEIWKEVRIALEDKIKNQVKVVDKIILEASK